MLKISHRSLPSPVRKLLFSTSTGVASEVVSSTMWRFAHFVHAIYTQPIVTVDQWIIDLNRNGNSATFFSYVCKAKEFLKSCFILLKME